MKSNLRRIPAIMLAFLLIANLLVAYLPMDGNVLGVRAEALQQGGTEYQVGSTEMNPQLRSTNSFGSLLGDYLGDTADEQQKYDSVILSVDIVDQYAVVEFETMHNATVVVGVYDEECQHLLASGSHNVTSEDTTAWVEIDADPMPQYFYLKVFLIDSDSLRPLCPAFDSPMFTKAMQELLALETTDFDADRVLNLDDNTNTNFAVYNEDTIVVPQASGNNVVSADDEANTYVIENIDDHIRLLNVGDVFAYEYEDGNVIIVKVSSISLNGTTATIKGEETSLEEVFDYVKIEGIAGLGNADVDTTGLEDGVVYNGVVDDSYNRNRAVAKASIDISGSTTKSLSYEFLDKEFGNDDESGFSGKLSGSLNLKMVTTLKAYITISSRYIELKQDYSASIEVSVTGKLEGKIPLGEICYPIVPGCYLELKPTFNIGISGTISLKGSLSGTLGFKVTDDGIDNLTKMPKLELELKAELKVYLGVSLNPKLIIIAPKVVEIGVSAELGCEVTGSMSFTHDTENPLEQHACVHCIDGDICGKVTVGISASLLNLKKFKFKREFSYEDKVTDFYYSFDYDEFGFTECPHKEYRISVYVLDETGNITNNVKVTVNDKVYKTDSSGLTLLYLTSGTYTFSYEVNGNIKTHSIKIKESAQRIIFRLKRPAQTEPTEPTDPVAPPSPPTDPITASDDKLRLGEYSTGFINDNGDLFVWGNEEDTPTKVLSNVQSFSLSDSCYGAVTKDGNLYMWGDNSLGQVGDGTTAYRHEPVKIMTNVASVILDGGRSAAVKTDGSLYMWGYNLAGSRGDDNYYSDILSPTKILSNIKSFSMGIYHFGAVTDAGDLYMWGYNTNGQVGFGEVRDGQVSSPTKVLANVKSLELREYNSAAITTDGSLYMWGENFDGQIGNATVNEVSTPTKIMSDVIDVGLGDAYSSALTKSGDLYIWGSNEYEQLGTPAAEYLSPRLLMKNVVSISAGHTYLGAIKDNADLYMWGKNSNGVLGDGTTNDRDNPVKVLSNVKEVSLSKVHSGAVTNNGILYMWGDDSWGQLGTGIGAQKLTPTVVTIPSSATDSMALSLSVDSADSLVSVVSACASGSIESYASKLASTEYDRLSLGDMHTGYISDDGTLYMWGKNANGQLGDGSTTDCARPTEIMRDISAISLGGSHSAALTTDGSLYTWGCNEDGQLGDGTTTDKNTPVKIMDDVVSVSLGEYHSAAITANGSLYTWGWNKNGQLGDGTTVSRLTPVKVMDDVAAVSLGGWYSTAITADGSLYTWGTNSNGQLGDGTTNKKTTPQRIMGNIQSVSAGWSHCAAIDNNGNLYTWGDDSGGALGNGDLPDNIVPAKVFENVVAISMGSSHSAAITSDGCLYTWGANELGQLGTDQYEYINEPHLIMYDVAAVSLGYYHSAVVTTNGNIHTCGWNIHGQLGDGNISDSNVANSELINLTQMWFDFEDAQFSGLEPNETYNFYVLRERGVQDPFSDYNLLYISQGVSDENGSISFAYTPKDDDSDAEKFVVRMTPKDVSNATAEIGTMIYTGEEQFVSPTVTLDGVTLAEGVDYDLCGDYAATAPGLHTVIVRGRGMYSGEAKFDYCVNLDVSFATSSYIVTLGNRIQLTTKVNPSGADNSCLVFRSANSNIAQIDSTGLVTGLSVGTATMYVGTKGGSLEAKCTVRVVNNSGSANVLDSGVCGQYVQWTLYDNGVLVIRGKIISDSGGIVISETGPTYDYADPYSIPWYDNRKKVENIFVSEGVTYIGRNLFSGCDHTRTISISAEVTGISPSALYTISNTDFTAAYIGIREFLVARSNPTYCSIDGVLFSKNKTELVCFPNGVRGEYVVPDSVSTISEYAFSHSRISSVVLSGNIKTINRNAFEVSRNLSSIDIPYGLEDIGVQAFYCCDSLTQLNLPGSVTAIGPSSFAGCSSINDLVINEGCVIIGYCAFENCRSIVSVRIPDSVKEICSEAFFCCTKLETVSIGSGVETISTSKDGSFYCCDSLRNITVSEDNDNFMSIDNVIYTKNGKKLVLCAPAQTGFFVVPDTVETIGECSFYGCDSLTTIFIPKSVNTIERYAFLGDGLRLCYIYSKNCSFDREDIFGYKTVNGSKQYYTTIYTSAGSTVEKYAESRGIPFILFDTPYEIVPVILSDALELNNPFGLRYFATYVGEDINKIVNRGIAILKDEFYNESMTAEEFCANGKAYIFTTATNNLDYESDTERYYATLSDGIYPYNFGSIYYAVPFAELDNGQVIYGEIAKSSVYTGFNTDLTAYSFGCSVTLTWKVIEGADGYDIFRCDRAGQPYSLIAGVDANETSYIDTGLSIGTTYYYKVRAYIERTNGTKIYCDMDDDSAAEKVTIESSVPAISSAVTDTNKVTLSWNSITGATSYRVFRADTKTGAKTLLKAVNATTYTDTTAVTGKTYYYFVKAYSSTTGVLSDYSAAKEVTVKAAAAIAAPTISSAATDTNKVTLSWNSITGATSYRVYRADTKTGAKTLLKAVTTTTYTDTTAVTGKTYYYFVAAYNSAAGILSNYSVAKSVTVKAAATIAAPTISSSVTDTNKVTLSWNSITGATSYRIYRADTKTGAKTLLKAVNPTTYTDTTAATGKTYYYFVKAYNSTTGVLSDYSAAKEVTVKAAPAVTTIDAPVISSVSTNTNKVTINWDKVTGATSYRVYRITDGTRKELAKITTTTYVDTTVTTGKMYHYEVKAYIGTAGILSAYSAKRAVKVIAAPVITSANISPKITWSKVADATSYRVFRTDVATGKRILLKAVGVSTTSYTVTAK